MYDKTITVFNKYVNQKDEIYWYPTVIKNVQLIVDKSANVAKTGLENADTASLHIKFRTCSKQRSEDEVQAWVDVQGNTILDINGNRILIYEPIDTLEQYKYVVAGKKYLPPKEWISQVNDILPKIVTLASGDFFVEGEYSEEIVADEDYRSRIDGGFYDYMNKKHDNVFLITSVGMYTLIPHFEIGGK